MMPPSAGQTAPVNSSAPAANGAPAWMSSFIGAPNTNQTPPASVSPNAFLSPQDASGYTFLRDPDAAEAEARTNLDSAQKAVQHLTLRRALFGGGANSDRGLGGMGVADEDFSSPVGQAQEAQRKLNMISQYRSQVSAPLGASGDAPPSSTSNR